MIDNTFSSQKQLPIMPVPDLKTSCHKLMEWAEPLLTEKEVATTRQVMKRFLLSGGDGEKLQNELVEWNSHGAESNWLLPIWRNLYLESRSSLVINSNVFYYLKSKLDEKICSQANIASSLIVSIYHFIALIDNKELTIDMQKNTPLCMNQYKNLFSSTRIAQLGTDELKVSSLRKHIVVMHNQHLYKIDILNAAGVIRSAVAIEHDLEWVIAIPEKGQNLGLLTTMPRDDWAKSRADLLQISVHNKTAMMNVEEAAFVLCLDKSSPEEITEVSEQLLHGNGCDRFFDKSLQFIVFKNGKTGINFEHAGVDGSVMVRMIEHIYDTIDKVSFDGKILPAEIIETDSSNVEEIEFELDGALKQTIRSAADLFSQHIADTQTRVLNFSQFGKNTIKQFGVSPDAFVQLALQLAEYKLYGKCYSAYEAVMTRTFLDGRMDVLYTVSPESMTFIQNICDANCSNQTKIHSLIKAEKKHRERANECRLGLGVYTHFMALEYRYKKAGSGIGLDKLPEIFTDKGFQALNHCVVCTSTTSDYGVELAGYGPIVDDGYGIRYFKRSDSICFNMTSRSEIQDKLDLMKRYIEESLLEMSFLMKSRIR